AIHIATRPSEKQTAWKRETTGRSAETRGPSRVTAIAYPAPSSPTMSQTSGCAVQRGTLTASPTGIRHTRRWVSRQRVEGGEDDQVQEDRRRRAEDEEPPEQRRVGAQMHVPRRDEEELDERHHEEQRDDGSVRKRAL